MTLQQFVLGGSGDLGWMTVLFVAVALVGVWTARDKPWLTVTVTWLVVPLFVIQLISFGRPLYVDRYLIGALPPFMILIVAGLIAIYRWHPGVGAVGGGLLIGLMSVAAVHTWDGPKENWRAAAAFIHEHAAPSDVVVMRSVYYLSMNYYYAGPPDVVSMDAGWELQPPEALTGQRIWIVYRGDLGHVSQGGELIQSPVYQGETDDRVRAWLRAAAPHFVEGHDFNSVALLLYDFSP
jgi:hypothetical protein